MYFNFGGWETARVGHPHPNQTAAVKWISEIVEGSLENIARPAAGATEEEEETAMSFFFKKKEKKMKKQPKRRD